MKLKDFMKILDYLWFNKVYAFFSQDQASFMNVVLIYEFLVVFELKELEKVLLFLQHFKNIKFDSFLNGGRSKFAENIYFI